VFSLEQTRVALGVAVSLWDELADSDPAVLAELRERLGLRDDERTLWEDVLDRLVVVEPDPSSRVLEQFRGYLDLEDVPPAEVASRLQHPDEYWGWPNGVAVHTQVLKQADVVQLFVNQPERYERDVIEANLDYYLPRTQHGSSLSRPMHALVAARLGRVAEAYELFLRGATVDLLADSHPSPGGTFIGGIHTAACGAAWQVAVLGFGGVHVRDTHVEVAPRLPHGWSRLAFGLAVRGSWLEVEATPSDVLVRAAADNPQPVAVELHGTPLEVAPGEELAVAIDLPEDVVAPVG
jgi:trehalose/maltose hydrolase-like predicted phosphorylase